MNRVIMLGNLTKDLELRYLPNGGAVCSAGIATNRKFTKKDGTTSEEVCFIDITFFGRTAEVANQYLAKGRKVLVEGRLKLDQWTDQSGNNRSKHSIVVESMQMLGVKGENNLEQQKQKNTPKNNENDTPTIDIDEDEIPF